MAYKDKNKERENNRKWQAAHREQINKRARERGRKQRAANPEKIKKYNREWRAANLEKVRESSRKSICKQKATNPEEWRKKTRERNKKWRLAHPEQMREIKRKWVVSGGERNSVLKNKFGITLEDYHKILDKQNHRCAICGIHQSKHRKALAVDHDHKTGKIRGLLCDRCNQTLGAFEDSIHLLEKAIQYLRQHINSQTEG